MWGRVVCGCILHVTTVYARSGATQVDAWISGARLSGACMQDVMLLLRLFASSTLEEHFALGFLSF